ncbi:somatostatin receptor type 5-like [Lytechinus pictus]|uniref:somatostatin receptor type 5-like n=1 Tax=Lytechinus pictus TaxID=7653 RepID=UPI0030B9FC0F
MESFSTTVTYSGMAGVRQPEELFANLGYNDTTSSTIGTGLVPSPDWDPTNSGGGSDTDATTDPAFGIALACLTIPVVLVGSLANIMVLYVVLRFKKMHNVINYSFANLALADLLGLLIDAVPAIVLTLKSYSLSDPGCRTLLYIPWTIRQAACLTLAYLAFDRYRLIIHPTSSVRSRSPPFVLTVLAVLWIVSSIVQLPTAILTGLDKDGRCREYLPVRGGGWYYWVKILTIYVIPLAVITISYFKIWRRLSIPRGAGHSRGSIKMRTFRKRSARRILVIVFFFAITWFPILVVHIWPHYDPNITEDTPRYGYVHRLTNFVLYVSMMLNPFLYAFAGEGFKKHFRTFAGRAVASSVDLDRERTPDIKGIMQDSTLRREK